VSEKGPKPVKGTGILWKVTGKTAGAS